MSNAYDQQTLLLFRGLISSMPEEGQQQVREATQKIRSVLSEYPNGEGVVALGLISAELQLGEGG
jgi:hypothetical protein